eukprot:2306424-Lingulodinium_polyedra.AAC.1
MAKGHWPRARTHVLVDSNHTSGPPGMSLVSTHQDCASTVLVLAQGPNQTQQTRAIGHVFALIFS